MHNNKDRPFGKNIINGKVGDPVIRHFVCDKENMVNEAIEKKEVREVIQNPQVVSPYQQEIYEFLTLREQEERPPQFSINDYFINENIRNTTVKYIRRLCNSYEQRTQTYYQAIHLLDQIIQLTNPKSDDMELLSLTCLFIASKYEEIYPPPLYMILKNTSVKITEVIQKEKEILQLLNFNVISETTLVWMQLLMEMLNSRLKRAEVIDRCMKLAEITLLHSAFLNYRKSEIALCVLMAVEMIFGIHKTQFLWEQLSLHTKPSLDSKPLKMLTYLQRHYK